MAITLKKLEKFCKVRMKSGFMSNLQFVIDLKSCGLTEDDIGEAEKTNWLGWDGYRWKTPVGVLVEVGRAIWVQRLDETDQEFLERTHPKKETVSA